MNSIQPNSLNIASDQRPTTLGLSPASPIVSVVAVLLRSEIPEGSIAQSRVASTRTTGTIPAASKSLWIHLLSSYSLQQPGGQSLTIGPTLDVMLGEYLSLQRLMPTHGLLKSLPSLESRLENLGLHTQL